VTSDSRVGAASATVRRAIDGAVVGLVGRRSLVELAVLAAVAGEHLLVIGPPGTAKSAAVRRVARQLGGNYFEYLLSRFTEPSELFGPVDLGKLREGRVEVQTRGMLPEAHVAFLDEVFLGSTAILNNLLMVLNEQRFRHGHTDMHVPLRVCVGASNSLPSETSLAAFADRFLLRVFVEPIEDAQLEDLLEQGWAAEQPTPYTAATMNDLDLLSQAMRGVDLAAVRPRVADAARALRNGGVTLSDRRLVKTQRLIAAAAVLAGRAAATEADLWPLFFAVPTQDDQVLARDLLRDLLQPSENGTLRGAAEEASAGPAARATRLVEAAQALLQEDGAVAPERQRLRLEALLREIDAGFGTESLPAALAVERTRIASRLAAAPTEPAAPQLTPAL